MDHLDKEVIESLSEPAKRVFKSLDYRSKQRMLKKAREMAKAEKMIRRKKSRFKKKALKNGIKAKSRRRAAHPKVSVSFFLFTKQGSLWCSPCI